MIKRGRRKIRRLDVQTDLPTLPRDLVNLTISFLEICCGPHCEVMGTKCATSHCDSGTCDDCGTQCVCGERLCEVCEDFSKCKGCDVRVCEDCEMSCLVCFDKWCTNCFEREYKGACCQSSCKDCVQKCDKPLCDRDACGFHLLPCSKCPDMYCHACHGLTGCRDCDKTTLLPMMRRCYDQARHGKDGKCDNRLIYECINQLSITCNDMLKAETPVTADTERVLRHIRNRKKSRNAVLQNPYAACMELVGTFMIPIVEGAERERLMAEVGMK